jgi:hypothetical protein
MKIFEFIALSRSGHHAMLNWILQNLVGFQLNWEYKITRLGDTSLYYINEGNYGINFTFDFIEKNIKDMKNLFIGYENVDSNFTIFRDDKIYRGSLCKIKFSEYEAKTEKRIVFIRDFYNNLSSRIRANMNEDMFIKTDGKKLVFDVEENFIKIWKQMATSILKKKVAFLKYEDWLENSEIRNEFLIENFNTHQIYDFENIIGTSSSFGESKNYKKRFDPNLIPEKIKEIIRKDTELHYLIGRLGYEFVEI